MATASRHDSFGMPMSSALAKFVVITIDPMIENNTMNAMETIPTVLLYRVCSKYSDCNRIERIISDFVLDSKRKEAAACLLYFQRKDGDTAETIINTTHHNCATKQSEKHSNSCHSIHI